MPLLICVFFFFNDTATTEIYTLSLHDALPISPSPGSPARRGLRPNGDRFETPVRGSARRLKSIRSEEHTSELQSRPHLVCRLLLEKKKKHAVKSTRACISRQNLVTRLKHTDSS